MNIVKRSLSLHHQPDGSRLASYVLVALAAFLAGYVLGLIANQPSAGSRADWPAPENPRSFSP
jgi:hypothetical protein